MPKSRLATLAYLVLVFGSGTMVGAVAHRLYVTSSVTASTVVPKTPAQARKDFLEKLKVRLTASPDQVTQVNTILDEAKQKYSRLELEAKPLRDKIDGGTGRRHSGGSDPGTTEKLPGVACRGQSEARTEGAG